VLAGREVLGVFEPGDHGSTFGGNPLACAVATAALRVLVRDRLAERAAWLGTAFLERLQRMASPRVREARGRGLLIGIELDAKAGPARRFAEDLLAEGVLCKETAERVLRIAPPLVIDPEDLNWAFDRIARVLA
jgi:ornithine--oxo-acid transaminase